MTSVNGRTTEDTFTKVDKKFLGTNIFIFDIDFNISL